VTIVGNDSGGAVSQILVTTRPERIARLVLTNCDCFEKSPPGQFKVIAKMLKAPGAAAARVSETNLALYRTYMQPFVRACVNPMVLEKSKLQRWQPFSMERGPGN